MTTTAAVTDVPEEVQRAVYFCTRVRDEQYMNLPLALVQAFLEKLTPEEQEYVNTRTAAEKKHLAAEWLYFKWSCDEATRLGYALSDTRLLHQPVPILAKADGFEAGAALARQYKFESEDPGSMWDVMQWRREGEAAIAFCGDDRGYSPQYWVILAWAPERFADDLDKTWCPLVLNN